jgi:formylglycine-generating enzyme required for sulfatase activity
MESSDADKSVANSEVEVQFSQREVTISKSFEIGKYEVTFDEYDLFAHETRRPLPDHKGWGRGKQPVIDVSLEDARNYADWLSTRTGKRYRLPTEAEWEYAARGGTTTLFWWGDHMEFDRANCSDCESRPRKKPAPVGSFRPNPFGVYDTAGNVWEWVQGSWLRGGSWAQPGEAVRSGHRVHMDPTFKNNGTGFRLARDVE